MRRVTQGEAHEYLSRKFGLDIEEEYFVELWKGAISIEESADFP